MTAFPCENLYHLIENHSFGCHWNRHLLSFRDENNMVYMPQFILSFPTKCTGDNPDIKFIYQFPFGRVAVYHALLLVIDGIGDVHFSVGGVYRQSVINRAAVFEERTYRHMAGCHVHAPNGLVDPVEFVPVAIELHLRGPVAQLELELLLHGEGLGIDAVERRGFVTVGLPS